MGYFSNDNNSRDFVEKIQNLCWNSSSKCLLSKAFRPRQRICRTVNYAIPPQNQLVMRKTPKSFMAFDIIPRMPVFTVVAGSQIVDPPTIPPSQWHSRDSNPWPWLKYHLSDCELCHSTSKLIRDEEDIFKSFMAFDITPCRPFFRVLVGNQILVPPNKNGFQRLLFNTFSKRFSLVNN